jgi:hypothetical protein
MMAMVSSSMSRTASQLNSAAYSGVGDGGDTRRFLLRNTISTQVSATKE